MIKKDLDWDDKTVLKLRPPADTTSNDTMIWHPVIGRFGIRFRRKPGEEWGRGVYTVEYFKGGRDRRMSLKLRVGDVLYAVAKQRAQEIKDDASDPEKDPRIERIKAKATHSEVVRTFIPDFIADQKVQGLSKGHVDRTEIYLTQYFPDLLDVPVKMVTREQVADGLRKILNSNPDNPTPIAMTRARSALSKFMRWLMQQGKIEHNPVINTASYSSEEGTRFLSPEELAAVWNAASPDWEFGRIVRLLILTGARRDQICSLRKREVRQDECQIVLPKKLSRKQLKKQAALGKAVRKGGSKNGEEFKIPLSRQALALLNAQPERIGSEFVFGDGGLGGFSGWSNSMTALRTRIGDQIDMEENPWTLHDLRRTFVTLATEILEIEPHIVDAGINHKPKFKEGVAGIYNQAKLLKKRTEVMQAWADYVENLVKPKLHIVTA